MGLFTSKAAPVVQDDQATLDTLQADLNKHTQLEQQVQDARRHCDELRTQLEDYGHLPTLVANKSDSQIQAEKDAIQSQLYAAMRALAAAQEALADHTIANGDVSTITAKMRDVQMRMEARDQQTARQEYRTKLAEMLKLGEAMKQCQQDIDAMVIKSRLRWPQNLKIGQAELQEAAGLVAVGWPEGTWAPSFGNGPSCVLWNGIKWSVARYDSSLLPADDEVLNHLREIPSLGNSIQFRSFGGS